MLNVINKLFSNVDYFAECASQVDMRDYRNIVRGNRIDSHDGREEGAYFCALPKTHCDSFELATPTPALLII